MRVQRQTDMRVVEVEARRLAGKAHRVIVDTLANPDRERAATTTCNLVAPVIEALYLPNR